MSDDYEDRFRRELRELRLPRAPNEIRSYLNDLGSQTDEPSVRRNRGRWLVYAPVVIAVVAVIWMYAQLDLSLQPGQTSLAGDQSAGPTADSVDGVAVMTVSELFAERAGPKAPNGPYALRGFWSVRVDSITCEPSILGRPADLELSCNDGLFGITQDDEAITTLHMSGLGEASAVPAHGPHLTPWVSSQDDQKRLWSVPGDWTPVPIVVVGHFDDPLASECPSDVRQTCVDRLVIDRIVTFDPTAVPAPTAPPSPTPFPISDPPEPLFVEGSCFPDDPKSFVGWAMVRELKITLMPDWDPSTYVFAMTTRDPVMLGDPADDHGWINSPDYPGHKVRWWGQHVCFRESPGRTLFGGNVVGTTYLEVDDGRRIPTPYPFG